MRGTEADTIRKNGHTARAIALFREYAQQIKGLIRSNIEIHKNDVKLAACQHFQYFVVWSTTVHLKWCDRTECAGQAFSKQNMISDNQDPSIRILGHAFLPPPLALIRSRRICATRDKLVSNSRYKPRGSALDVNLRELP
jgi:hypothetical protein